jgi:hypothetical protein
MAGETGKNHVKDLADLTLRVERWIGGTPVEVLHESSQPA